MAPLKIVKNAIRSIAVYQSFASCPTEGKEDKDPIIVHDNVLKLKLKAFILV